jgi:hypothetical protein
MNLASHLYEHTWKPSGVNTELPTYITLIVNELLKFAHVGVGAVENRAAYVKNPITAAVGAEKATANTVLANPKPDGHHRTSWSSDGDNSQTWRHVEEMSIEGLDLAAAAAAVGNTEALWHYLAWDTVPRSQVCWHRCNKNSFQNIHHLSSTEQQSGRL